MSEEIFEVDYDLGKHYKSAKIKPSGFWGSMVRVTQDMEFSKMTMNEPEISWSCGGTDGTLSNADATKSFIAALKFALEIKEKWEQEGK